MRIKERIEDGRYKYWVVVTTQTILNSNILLFKNL